jgi:FMN reductase
MIRVVAISGSPSASSRTLRLVRHFGASLTSVDIDVTYIDVRELPAEDLLLGRASSPALAAPFRAIASAAGIVVGTPIYKAAYSGVLKTFLDVLPSRAFAGKIVVPLVTGGTPAHALALEYALCPVLTALGSLITQAGLFVLDRQIGTDGDGATLLDGETEQQLMACSRGFSAMLGSARRGDVER